MRGSRVCLVCTVSAAFACFASDPLPAQTTDQGAQVVVVSQVPRLRALDQAYLDAAAARITPERSRELLELLGRIAPADLREKLRQGGLTSVELAAFYLARIGMHDEELRSVLEVNPAALEEAAASDLRLRVGGGRGPLDGFPVILKDNIETAGPMHTTANAAILLDNVAASDAAVVERLRGAGAVILGKASLSEFAGPVQNGSPMGGAGAVGGQTINPYGPYPTFGSSSGPAVAVSALLAHMGVGTETSGSLIAPATAAGIVALKPTKGRIPGDGIIPLISHNDTAGPMGRTVEDVAALFSVLALDSKIDPSAFDVSALDRVAVGLLAGDIAADPQFAGVLPRLTSVLATAGADVRPAELTDKTGEMKFFGVLLGSGVRHEVLPYVSARHPEIRTPEDLIAWNAREPRTRVPFGQDLLEVMAQVGASVSVADHEDFGLELGKVAHATLETALADAGAEVLISTSSIHAPLYATAGWPAVTVPLGLSASGMPNGITIIGRKGEDERILAMAWAIEQTTQARVAPPVAGLP